LEQEELQLLNIRYGKIIKYDAVDTAVFSPEYDIVRMISNISQCISKSRLGVYERVEGAKDDVKEHILNLNSVKDQIYNTYRNTTLNKSIIAVTIVKIEDMINSVITRSPEIVTKEDTVSPESINKIIILPFTKHFEQKFKQLATKYNINKPTDMVSSQSQKAILDKQDELDKITIFTEYKSTPVFELEIKHLSYTKTIEKLKIIPDIILDSKDPEKLQELINQATSQVTKYVETINTLNNNIQPNGVIFSMYNVDCIKRMLYWLSGLCALKREFGNGRVLKVIQFTSSTRWKLSSQYRTRSYGYFNVDSFEDRLENIIGYID